MRKLLNEFVHFYLPLWLAGLLIVCGTLAYTVYKAQTVQAAITRTARGTANSATAAATLVISVTAATGSSLVVGSYCGINTRTVSSVSWAGGTFAKDKSLQNSNHTIEVWSAHNVTGGTNNLTVTWSGNCGARESFVTELIPTNGPLVTDTSVSNSGTLNPATTTAITSLPNSSGHSAWIAALAVERANTDAAPTWAVPTTAGQKDGQSTVASYIAEGYEIDANAMTQAASSTMATAATWTEVMATYKEPAATLPKKHQVIIISQAKQNYDI